MIGMAIDALLVIAILKTVADREIGFWTAALIGLVASTATTALANRLIISIGHAGIIAAAPVAALLLAMGLIWGYGVNVKRACLGAATFTVVHLGYVTLVSWLWYGQL